MILVIDNYDSFTWNIVHYLQVLGVPVEVARNDAIGVEDALAAGASGIVLSPGPGRPEEAGISLAIVAACADARRPLLGICLGHQAIAAHFGAEVARAPRPMHGKTSVVAHDGGGLFAGLPSPIVAARYHSLAVQPQSVVPPLRITATAEDGTVQGIAHVGLPMHGIQFHPESVASEHGHKLLANFLALAQQAGEAARTASLVA